MKKGMLILENGAVFQGTWIGAEEERIGEVVFTTSMTGYQETLTDPSYAGQIVTFTYPLIGNYGINLYDDEAIKPAVAGLIMGEIAELPSHYLSVQSFSDHLQDLKISALTGVDTRALVRMIREKGTMLGTLHVQQEEGEAKARHLKMIEEYTPPFWIEEVSSPNLKHFGGEGPHILLIDYGFKKSIVDALLKEGCRVTVAPYSISFEEVKKMAPDGILFSNGPGDPMELHPWFKEVKAMTMQYPSLGICLGHQVIALAHGAKTEKLPFGHRGANHPVKEVLTGKVWITPQNHGYVVTEESLNQEEFIITYRNLNDQSIEGLKHRIYPIETVQFHPEAHPGPTDTQFIIASFVERVRMGEKTYAVR
ncbi:MAG: carbamoyl phosphate synthase small subunit [Thermicanus sp.]|nr:carbamoyl phosphate synthase small subunit [Thermicanus sp.]